MKRCTVIGISDSRQQWFPPTVANIIASGKVFSGGKRHREIVGHMLPADAVWIDITVPISNVFSKYEEHAEIIIFASGDPLFYGFANTVQRECPNAEMTVIPSFNSLQMLAHRLLMPYQDMKIVSLTGRSWEKFDEALICGEHLMGCLTDKRNTPQAIWQRMRDYGYDNYEMFIGENLGNEDSERIIHIEANETIFPEKAFDLSLNCVILQKLKDRPRPLGIPEQAFHLLNGRQRMITKMPIRLLSLSMLNLRDKHTFWDVGFCTGSVSIEAKLQFPHLSITAFEVREEGRELIEQNSRKFGTPGITAVIGDFMQQDITQYPKPDAVFIGGHGGKLIEMIAKLKTVLTAEGCIVFNSVSEESRQMFEEGCKAAGMTITQSTRIAIDSHNPIYIMKAQ